MALSPNYCMRVFCFAFCLTFLCQVDIRSCHVVLISTFVSVFVISSLLTNDARLVYYRILNFMYSKKIYPLASLVQLRSRGGHMLVQSNL